MKKFRTSAFYQSAIELIEDPRPITERDIAMRDMTETFYKEIDEMIKNKESINININAPVRKGKSTVLLQLGKYIQERLKHYELTNKSFDIWNIARTQYELSKKMRDPKLNNTFIAIDEYDDLEDTGENTTVDQALLKHFSKIQAGRYIHRGYCSPADSPDSESNIILNIIQADRQAKITHCRLYYKIYKGNTEYVQLIGHVNINVSEVIKNWTEKDIETKFYKQGKTEKDKEYIEEWRKKDFYVEYMCRKFEKMDMLNEKGIFRTKELDYADIIYEIILDLQDLTKIGGLTTKQITNHVRAICRQKKVPQSLVGEKVMTDRIEGILSLMTQFHDQKRKHKKIISQLKGKPTNTTIMKEIEIIERGMTKLKEVTETEIEELKYLIEIKRKYYGDEM